MNDELNIAELFLKITSGISELKAKMENVGDTINRHEERIHKLEIQNKDKSDKSDKSDNDSFAKQIAMLLAKCLVISASAIAASAGAVPILKSIFCS